MFNILNDYITTKTAAADARKSANAAIAIEGNHDLPKSCDRESIHKAFVSLAKSNKKTVAIVDGINGAVIFAEAEAKRQEKRDAKRAAEAAAFEATLNERINALLDAELADAIAATAAATTDNVAATA